MALLSTGINFYSALNAIFKMYGTTLSCREFLPKIKRGLCVQYFDHSKKDLGTLIAKDLDESFLLMWINISLS